MMPIKDPHYVDLEALWRKRLNTAEERLARAVTESKRVFSEFQEGVMPPPDGSLAVRKVRIEESRARENYMRILRTFTDLALYGKAPREDAASGN